MKCSDLQINLSLYADGVLGDSDAATISRHLELCPLCRQAYAEIRELRAGLRQMSRPELSAYAAQSIKSTLDREIKTSRHSLLPLSSSIREWLKLSVMPYGVGAFASVAIGLSFLTLMFSGGLRNGPFSNSQSPGDREILLASNRHTYNDDVSQSAISQSDYARERLAFASESPSVNPQGALIALTRSFVRGGMKDDEVVVVADVFGNGLAQIAEVIEPSRDRRAVGELQKALDSDPAYAPFVPANLENRPDNVRVVLKFQSVNVSTSANRDRQRRRSSS
jgi:anti-sigma factor RsiW